MIKKTKTMIYGRYVVNPLLTALEDIPRMTRFDEVRTHIIRPSEIITARTVMIFLMLLGKSLSDVPYAIEANIKSMNITIATIPAIGSIR